jgi:hypothetical protein
VRDEIVARYDKLDLPRYYAGIYATLGADPDPAGRISTVHFSYPQDPVQQYLNFAAMYDPDLAPAKHQAETGPHTGNLAREYALMTDRPGAGDLR